MSYTQHVELCSSRQKSIEERIQDGERCEDIEIADALASVDAKMVVEALTGHVGGSS